MHDGIPLERIRLFTCADVNLMGFPVNSFDGKRAAATGIAVHLLDMMTPSKSTRSANAATFTTSWLVIAPDKP